MSASPTPTRELDPAGKDPLQAELQICLDAGLFPKQSGWKVEKVSEEPCTWMHVHNGSYPSPTQGYKLHVSATSASAPEVLHRVLPLLQSVRVSFKFAATLGDLRFLSCGKAGSTQIGKFITVYPRSDLHAVDIAGAVHNATIGLAGALIPFENSVAEGSLVHYRYGAFEPTRLQLNSGGVAPALRSSDGVLQPDRRSLASDPECRDPFREAGFEVALPAPLPLKLCDRYLRVELLHQGPRGSCWLGIDVSSQHGDLVVVKEGRQGVLETLDGCDAATRLKHEAESLKQVQSSRYFPAFVDFWEENRKTFLVYRFIEGIPLHRLLLDLGSKGVCLDEHTLCRWFLEVCDALIWLHAQNLVFGDLKPANVILSSQGGLFLIDLELCGPAAELYQHSPGFGTPGYASRSQMNRGARSIDDDVFAFGATMFSLATMIDLSMCSTLIQHDVLLRSARPELSTPLSRIILGCVGSPGGNKPAVSLSEVRSLLQAQLDVKIPQVPMIPSPAVELKPSTWLSLACEIGDSLCREAVVQEHTAHWVSSHPIARQAAARGIYIGLSGVGLFLCDLFEATRDVRYLRLAELGAVWLHRGEGRIGRTTALPGLYFGEAGVGLFHLRLYRATQNPEYMERALAVGAQLEALECPAPDLLNGIAGVGLFHLFAFQATGSQQCLARAIDAGNQLVRERRVSTCTWPIPDGFEGLSGKQYLGFAHGSAGIGYFLVELHRVTGIELFAGVVRDVVGRLSADVLPALDDDSGVNWPQEPGGKLGTLHWCHGAPGIVRFLLRVSQVLPSPEVQSMAVNALKTISRGGSFLGTTQCHGLAGNLEVLLDAYQVLADPVYLRYAASFATLLSHYRCRDKTGSRWHSERPDVFTPDFMVGEAGIGSAFLRMSNPSHAPHAMSFALNGSTGPDDHET